MVLRWRFHPARELAAFAAEWDGVNADAGRLPCLESAFLVPLLAQFAHGGETLAFGWRGERRVAAALLRRTGTGQVATFQPSQLPLGPWLVVAGEDGAAAAQSLLAQLPGLVLGLGLTQLDPRLQTRPLDGPRANTLDYIPTAWVDVAGPFDAYWEARGKNLRSNMRKQRSKLDADGTAVTFDTLTDAVDVPAALADYGRLETAGWKAGIHVLQRLPQVAGQRIRRARAGDHRPEIGGLSLRGRHVHGRLDPAVKTAHANIANDTDDGLWHFLLVAAKAHLMPDGLAGRPVPQRE